MAWTWPRGLGQIQTSVQAGGMARDSIREIVSSSSIRAPVGSWKVKPSPARRRLMPCRSSETQSSPASRAVETDSGSGTTALLS